MRENFIEEWSLNEKRFEERIKRNTIMNFCSIQKKKITVKNIVQQIKIHRHLFECFLGISLEQDLDIEKVLCYPMTPIPLSLCHLDGINKTDKSVLAAHVLKDEISAEHLLLDIYNTVLVHGFFFLYQLKDLPKTFGGTELKILKIIIRFPAKLFFIGILILLSNIMTTFCVKITLIVYDTGSGN